MATIWDEILNSIITKLTPLKDSGGTEHVANLMGKLGQNSKYMAKARESLGDVANMIDKDMLTKIANSIKKSEHAPVYRTPSQNELNKIASDVVKGKVVKIEHPTSERYISSTGKSPYTEGKYSIDKQDGMNKEVKIQSTAIADYYFVPDKPPKKGEEIPPEATGIIAIKFVSGDKYYDYYGTKKDYDDLRNAPSKGRHVTKTMTPKNWLPGYHRRKR